MKRLLLALLLIAAPLAAQDQKKRSQRSRWFRSCSS